MRKFVAQYVGDGVRTSFPTKYSPGIDEKIAVTVGGEDTHGWTLGGTPLTVTFATAPGRDVLVDIFKTSLWGGLSQPVGSQKDPRWLLGKLTDIGRNGVCPQYQQPWAPPPAYVASTYYSLGQAAVTGGKVYMCVAPGITGAASAPTTTGLPHVVDGAASWRYVGPTFTADPLAPTVTVTTVAPALTRLFRNTACAQTSPNVTTIVSNDSWFNPMGGLLALTINGIGREGSIGMGAIEFFTDTDTFATFAPAYVDYGMTFAVDGRFVQQTVHHATAGGGQIYYVVTLPVRKPKTRITVYFDTNVGGVGLMGVLTAPSATVWKEVSQPKLQLVGDSFCVAKGYNCDAGFSQMAAAIGAELGCIDAFGQAVGGSGYSVAISYPAELFINRLPYVASYQPDILVVWGSTNDTGTAAATLTAAVRDYIVAARLAAPSALIAVLGTAGPATAGAITAEAASRAGFDAAVALGLTNVYYVPVAADPQGPWITSGQTAYTGADAVHPLQTGIYYYGRRIGAAIIKAISP